MKPDTSIDEGLSKTPLSYLPYSVLAQVFLALKVVFLPCCSHFCMLVSTHPTLLYIVHYLHSPAATTSSLHYGYLLPSFSSSSSFTLVYGGEERLCPRAPPGEHASSVYTFKPFKINEQKMRTWNKNLQ